MKKCVLALTLLLAGNAYSMTITEMVNEVVNTNPAAQEQFKNYNSVYQELEKAKGGYLPKLDVYAGVGHEWVNNNNTGFEDEDGAVWQGRAVLRQDLFTGFGVTNDVKKQRARLYSAKYLYLNEVNSLSFETVQQYLATLRNLRLYDISNESIRRQSDYLAMIKDRVDSGLDTPSDLERGNAKIANLQTDNLMKENSYNESLIKLQRLLGRYIDGRDLVNPAFDPAAVPAGLQEGMDILSTTNPLLVSSLFDIDYQHYNHQQSRKDYYPTIYAEVTHDINNNMGGVDGKETETRAMLMLHYNLFNGMKDAKEVQKNVSLYNKSLDTKNRVARDLASDYQLTWSAHRLLGKQITYLRKNRNSLTKVLKSYKSEYKIGKRKLIDIIDLENEIYALNSKIISANHDMLLFKYKLLYAIGTLPQVIGVDIPVEYDTSDELPRYTDKLPVSFDIDGDNVTDAGDFCPNSKGGETISGCDRQTTEFFLSYPFVEPKPVIKTSIVNNTAELKENRLNVNTSVRSGFAFFEKGSAELSAPAVELMREIVLQLREASSSNTVEIFVYSDDNENAEDNYLLSSARAYNLFRIMLKNGISRSSLIAYAKNYDGQPGQDPSSYIDVTVKDSSESYDDVYEIFTSTDLSFINSGSASSETVGTLSAAGLESLKQFVLMTNTIGQNVAVDVINYSYDKSTATGNKKVGGLRAKAVAEELAGLGLSNARITSFGIDHELSEDDISHSAGAAKNRTYIIIHR